MKNTNSLFSILSQTITSHSVRVPLVGGFVLSFLAFLPPLAFLVTDKIFSLSNILGALLYFVVVFLLVAVFLTDLTTQQIPNSLNFCLLGCGVASLFVGADIAVGSHVLGLFIVSIPLFAIVLIAPGAFGMGDVKLMGTCGLILGWEQALLAAVIGIVIGGIQGIYFLATRKKTRKEHFAFGPALCIGIVFALFSGPLIRLVF